jgi:hypothetical protein
LKEKRKKNLVDMQSKSSGASHADQHVELDVKRMDRASMLPWLVLKNSVLLT